MADELFHLEVITPVKSVFAGEVAQVVAPGAKGLFGVLQGHVNYVTEVHPGPLSFSHQGQAHRYVVGGGFAQVGATRVVLLVGECQAASDIDAEAARRDMLAAERVLLEHEPSSREYLDARAALDMAQARVWAATGGEAPGAESH